MLLTEPHDTPDHFSNRVSFLVPIENTEVRLAWRERQEIVIRGDEETLL